MFAYYTGTLDSDMPGTFESDTGGTFNPLQSHYAKQGLGNESFSYCFLASFPIKRGS